MANTVSNNKTSHLVSSQVPFFVRGDHENFVRFMEAYYEYMEQEDKVLNHTKNIQNYQNVDITVDTFADKLYENFMKFIPSNILADKKMVLKHIKDFYRARGTEKAARFLMRIMYNEEIDFYYPKQDILKVSDGKWYIQKTLRITNVQVNGSSDSSFSALNEFVSSQIEGQTSGATATVEKVDRFYLQGVLIDELVLSNINGTFENNEELIALSDDANGTTIELKADTYGGVVSDINIIDGGSNYEIGDPVVILSNTGSGACATVAQISTSNLLSISVIDGGAGFQNNNVLLISGGGGSGANAIIEFVIPDSSTHPNTYNIEYTTIGLEANTPIGNAVYSNLNSANASNSLSQAASYFVYANTGPAKSVLIVAAGSYYTSQPAFSVLANSRILELGILGKMEIIDGGSNYTIGDEIEFFNVIGGYGVGALANVWNINTASSNAISEVRFKQMSSHIIGGTGYDLDYLPTANVRSATGTGANIAVTALLGTGAEFISANSSLGAIERITIINRGAGYSDARLDLTGSGSGDANAAITTIGGVYSYPGRFLNDDGFISSFNFIEDRDYYQSFSYVIKVKQSIDKYRLMMKTLNHPAGLKMFGEYIGVDTGAATSSRNSTSDNGGYIFVKKPFRKQANSIYIGYYHHALTNGTPVYLDYASGGTNISNGLYYATNVHANVIQVSQLLYSSNNVTGNVYVGTRANTFYSGSGVETTMDTYPWSPNSVSYFDAAYTANNQQILDSQKISIDNLVVGLQQNNIWSKINAMWLFTVSSNTTALINLKNPTGANAVIVGNVSFTSNSGMKGPGDAVSWIDSRYNAATMNANSNIFWVRHRYKGASNPRAVMNWSPSKGSLLYGSGVTGQTLNFVGSTVYSYGNAAMANDYFVFSARNNSTQMYGVGYIANNTNTVTTSYTGASNVRFFNNKSSFSNSNASIAVAGLGEYLTEGERANLYNIVESFIASI